jgi:hypothetical protein
MERFAVAAPAKNRAARSQPHVGASAKAKKESAVMPTETSIIRRRPVRSESRPQIGAKTNCISE